MEKIADFLGSKKGFRSLLKIMGFISLGASMANAGLLIIAAACLIVVITIGNKE